MERDIKIKKNHHSPVKNKRERERERERETDRQTDRQTDTHTYTPMHRYKNKDW